MKQKCQMYTTTLLKHLEDKKFMYYFAGLYIWHLSRTQNIFPLLLSLQQSEQPPFISYSNMCGECIAFEPECHHKCCYIWFTTRANQLGFEMPI